MEGCKINVARLRFTSPSAPRFLRDGELFEIAIQKMVDRWSGSIEAGEELSQWLSPRRRWRGVSLQGFPRVTPAGVTAIRPDELEFPNTMTDIDYDTWMLRYQNVPEVLKARFEGQELKLTCFGEPVGRPSCRTATPCGTTTAVTWTPLPRARGSA